jgi:uncharacterized protein DUF1573
MRVRFAILALLFVGAPVIAAEEPAAPAPKAVVVESSHDFGTVPPVEILHHTFEIRNEGNAPLEIQKVESDCKCTATDFDQVVPPGAVGKVNAAVDTKVLNGDVQGLLAVRTNDPAKPVIELHTKVFVRPLLSAKPGYGRWNMVQGEKEGVISQTIWSVDGVDFKVLRVDAPPQFRTSFRAATGDELKSDAKGSQWHVESAVVTTAETGPITGYIEVVTDHPTQPVLRIPVSGFVRPILHMTPPTGDFGEISLPKDLTSTFRLQNFATEKMTIVSAQSTVKGTKVDVVPVDEGRSWDIKLHFPASLATGKFKGVLRVRLDNPKAPVIEVPLSGTVVKAKPATGGAAATAGA